MAETSAVPAQNFRELYIEHLRVLVMDEDWQPTRTDVAFLLDSYDLRAPHGLPAPKEET